MNDPELFAKFIESLTARGLIKVALIIVGAILLTLVSSRILRWLANKLYGRHRLYILASVPLLRLAIIGGALVMMVRLIAPSQQNLLALVGAASLAIGFALKDYVSSLIAGVVAINERLYRPGDWIEVKGTYGEVTRIGMRTVEIVTPDDTAVFIPHKMLWTELISNANDGGADLQCVAEFYLKPDHDAAVVRERLYDVALTSPYLAMEKPVMVIAREQAWGSLYRLKAYPIDPRQQFRFTTDLTIRGKATLGRLGARSASVGTVVDGPG